MRLVLTSLFCALHSLGLLANPVYDRDSLQSRKRAWHSDAVFISVGSGAPHTDVFFNKKPDSRLVSREPSARNVKPALLVKVELPLSTHIGFNFTINRTAIDYAYEFKTGSEMMTWTALTANFRVNYHFFYGKAYDLYIGTGLGLKNERYHYTSVKGVKTEIKAESPILLGFETSVGVRYHLEGPIGLFAELGVSRTLVQLGFYLNPMAFKKSRIATE